MYLIVWILNVHFVSLFVCRFDQQDFYQSNDDSTWRKVWNPVKLNCNHGTESMEILFDHCGFVFANCSLCPAWFGRVLVSLCFGSQLKLMCCSVILTIDTLTIYCRTGGGDVGWLAASTTFSKTARPELPKLMIDKVSNCFLFSHASCHSFTHIHLSLHTAFHFSSHTHTPQLTSLILSLQLYTDFLHECTRTAPPAPAIVTR